MIGAKQVREIPATIRPRDPQAVMIAHLLRTAAYARVSTDSDDQASSLEAQTKFYTGYIKANPKWTFVKMYADEGFTGTQMRNRKEFLRLIADAKAGKIDLIVTKSISRFARNVVDCLSTVRDLKDNHGVAVYFEKENLMSTDPTAQLTLSIMASVAEEESRSISTNVRWRVLKKFEKGEIAVGRGLYGYKVENGDEYIINPAEAVIVRRIFGEFLKGKTIKQIAETLRAEGVPRGKKNKWSEAGIRYMLSNERYFGDAVCQKHYKLDVLAKIKKNLNDGTAKMYYVEDNHQGIIDKETFTAVQAELARRGGKGSPARYASGYAFSRKLVCGECGGFYRRSYQVKRKKGETAKTYIWHCKSRADGKGCNGHIYKEKEIEDAFLMAMHEVVGSGERLLAEVQSSVEQAITASGDFDAAEIETALRAKQAEMLELSKTKNSQAVTALMTEIDDLNNRLDICRQAEMNIVAVKYRIKEIADIIQSSNALTEFDEGVFKSTVDECKVHGRTLTIKFKCGIELSQDF